MNGSSSDEVQPTPVHECKPGHINTTSFMKQDGYGSGESTSSETDFRASDTHTQSEHLPARQICLEPGFDPAWHAVQTVALPNLPPGFTQADIVAILERAGFHDCYDVVNPPQSSASGIKRCHAFINFASPAHARAFKHMCEGILHVVPARTHVLWRSRMPVRHYLVHPAAQSSGNSCAVMVMQPACMEFQQPDAARCDQGR